jgi:tRNA(Ile)-lysidine synthase
MASSRKPPSSELVARVGRELRRHVPSGAHLTLALSGGVDSIVLLDLLAELAPAHAFELDCLHVNHGLSPNAAAWARFARAAARARGLRCIVRRADLAPFRALGTEGAARAARYALFEDAPGDFLVLAQHADDQAETVLLQLVRGAGVAGLAAMPALRILADARGPVLLRPLLGVGRAEIERHARSRGLEWVDDESNRDTRLARNFIRHRVLPLLHEVNRAATANLARSAVLLAEARDLVQGLGAADVAANTHDGRLLVAGLRELPPARARNALRWALAQAGLGVPDSAGLEALVAQLFTARADASIRFGVPAGEVRRYRGAVYFLDRMPPAPRAFRATWPGGARWPLAELCGVLRLKRAVGAGVAAAVLDAGPVEVRTRRGGERFRPDGARPRRPLKALLQEAGVPPWERERLPLLFCGGRLAWVPGVGVAADLRAAPGQRGVVPSWEPNSPWNRAPRAKAMLK